MKSRVLPDGFPADPDAWERLAAAAPGHVDDPECPYDPNDPAAVAAYWQDAVRVPQGGIPAVRAALEARRRGVQRGPKGAPSRSR